MSSDCLRDCWMGFAADGIALFVVAAGVSEGEREKRSLQTSRWYLEAISFWID